MGRHNTGPRLLCDKNGNFFVRRTVNGKTKDTSLFTKDKIKAEIAFGPYRLAAPDVLVNGRVTVKDAFDRFILERRDLIVTHNIICAGRRLSAVIGTLDITHIRPSHIYAHIDDMEKKGFKYSTAHCDVSNLKRVVNYCYEANIVPPSFMRPIFPKRLRRPEPRVQWVTIEQFENWMKFIAGIKLDKSRISRLEIFSMIGFWTGARKRAIETVIWDLVDWKDGYINFPGIGGPKTNKRKVNMKMSPELTDFLLRAYAERKNNYVLGTKSSIHQRFFYAMNKWVEIEGNIRFHPHILRHSFASIALQHGATMKDTAEAMGCTVATLDRVYGHLAKENRGNASAIISRARKEKIAEMESESLQPA
jgi:integrase